jgi:hypothetical protein
MRARVYKVSASYAVAIGQPDVVAHADLVAVVENGRAGQGEEQAVGQLDLTSVVVHLQHIKG